MLPDGHTVNERPEEGDVLTLDFLERVLAKISSRPLPLHLRVFLGDDGLWYFADERGAVRLIGDDEGYRQLLGYPPPRAIVVAGPETP